MKCEATFIDLEGLFIKSWSDSTEYSAEMLVEGAQSWRVNTKAIYPVLIDHHEIEKPYSPTFCHKQSLERPLETLWRTKTMDTFPQYSVDGHLWSYYGVPACACNCTWTSIGSETN